MRKLTVKIAAGMAVIVCLVILAEPFLLAILMLSSGSRVTSIAMTWNETLFHVSNSGSDPYQFSYLELPTSHVVLWGLASIIVLLLMSAAAMKWWFQTGVLKAFTSLRRKAVIDPEA